MRRPARRLKPQNSNYRILMNYIAAAPAIKLQQPALLLIYPTLEEAESVTFLHCLKEADRGCAACPQPRGVGKSE